VPTHLYCRYTPGTYLYTVLLLSFINFCCAEFGRKRAANRQPPCYSLSISLALSSLQMYVDDGFALNGDLSNSSAGDRRSYAHRFHYNIIIIIIIIVYSAAVSAAEHDWTADVVLSIGRVCAGMNNILLLL